MLKPEAEKLLQEGVDCVGELLRAARHFDSGFCRLCFVERGKQHSPDCLSWPLVLWRQRYNDAKQKEADAEKQPEMHL